MPGWDEGNPHPVSDLGWPAGGPGISCNVFANKKERIQRFIIKRHLGSNQMGTRFKELALKMKMRSDLFGDVLYGIEYEEGCLGTVRCSNVMLDWMQPEYHIVTKRSSSDTTIPIMS